MQSVDLMDYCFPIETRDVYTKNGDWVKSQNYKAIHRSDNGKQISIVGKHYKVQTNEELIDNLTGTLDKVGYKFYLDPSHSFVQDHRMRLQITFPDLSLKDSDSKIPLSLFVHNSYDYSEGVRIFWGAIRAICSNGMVFGKLLQKFYSKHTRHLNSEIIKVRFDSAYREIPAINERLKLLETEVVTEKVVDELKEQFSPKMNREVGLERQKEISMWMLFNLYTNYISHLVQIQARAQYQQKLSKIFNL